MSCTAFRTRLFIGGVCAFMAVAGFSACTPDKPCDETHTPRDAAACTAEDNSSSAITLSTGDQVPVTGTTWQITGLFIDPEHPAPLPDTIAGKALLVFGESSLTGNTGCGPISGLLDWSKPGVPSATADQATTLTITEIHPGPAGCPGAGAWYADQLLQLLHGDFMVKHTSSHQMDLVKDSDPGTDPQVIALTAPGS